MDSLTQAALGAAVAEAGMGGKRLGNRAILWGVALGTLPDLDIALYPWLDAVERLEWHRGISHSLLFLFLASPLIGWALSRLYRDHLSMLRATITVFAILSTHVLIDLFTVYGTMIFEPFSDRRVGFNNLFIIDPLYTLPILIGLIGAIIAGSHLRRRMVWNTIGLVLSSLYVVWSFTAKAVVNDRFVDALNAQGIKVSKYMTAPSPFNTILWRGVAADDEGIWIGYLSLLDQSPDVHLDFIPRGDELLGELADTRTVNRLRWFADGFHTASRSGTTVIINDWRFGEIRRHPAPISADNPAAPIFSWALRVEDGEWMPVALRPSMSRSEWIGSLWNRMMGAPFDGVLANEKAYPSDGGGGLFPASFDQGVPVAR